MKMNVKFETYRDAETWYQNSGVFGWEWFDGFREDDLIEFVFRNSNGKISTNQLIAQFLIARGQDLTDYNMDAKGEPLR